VKPTCQQCGESRWTSDGRCLACQTFPTLGFEIGRWIEERCAIPDRDQVGEPFLLTDEQWRFLLGYYRVNPHATYDKARRRWRSSLTYSRGGQICRPQKWGKGPFSGSIISAEAAGPVVFDGWDAEGRPVGRPQATPIIQLTALSEDQTDNVWMALLPMIALGDFGADIPETGLLRIYLPGGGYIEPVTAAAKSRLGQRTTFILQDQTESWTKSNGGRALADTQRRNLAGMGGRWLSTPNAWDPAEDSVAQYTAEAEVEAGDVFIDDVEPAEALSIRNKTERRRALRSVYGDSWWVDLDRVDSEIVALLPRDPAQAERWFLNRKQSTESTAFRTDVLEERTTELAVPADGSVVTLGIDGARFADALAVIATDVLTGHQWPLGIWERPPSAPDDYEHPLDEVDGVVSEAFARWSVWRAYIDPQYIEGLVEKWQGRWGAKVVLEWRTNRPRQIAYAVRAYEDAMSAGDVSLADDADFLRHLKQARRQKLNVYDDQHRQLHTLNKDRPDSPRKIDAAMAAVLSWEARGDCVAAGATKPVVYRTAGF
jgi:hypothetical protein